MEVNLITEQTIPCLVPVGRIDTVTSPEFDRVVQQQIDRSESLIIDLGQCNYLSSTGIRVLLAAFKKVKSKGGSLTISGVLPEVFQVLETTGLHRVFTFAPTNAAAAAEILAQQKTTTAGCSWQLDGCCLQFHPSETAAGPARYWLGQGIAGYDELGFAVGCGRPADRPGETTLPSDGFVATGGCVGFIPGNDPVNEGLLPDFRIPQHPEQAGVLVHQALSFGKTPAGWFRVPASSRLTLGHLLASVYQNRKSLLPAADQALAFAVLNFDETSSGITMGILLDASLKEQLHALGIDDFPGETPLSEAPVSICGARFECENLAEPSDHPVFETVLAEALTFENLVNVASLDENEPL